MTSSTQRPRHRRRSNHGFHSGPHNPSPSGGLPWASDMDTSIVEADPQKPSPIAGILESDFLYRDVPNWHGDELHLMKKKKHILIFIRNIFTCQALRADTFNFFFTFFPPKSHVLKESHACCYVIRCTKSRVPNVMCMPASLLLLAPLAPAFKKDVCCEINGIAHAHLETCR